MLRDYRNVAAGGENAVPEFDADGCGMQLPNDFVPSCELDFPKLVFSEEIVQQRVNFTNA